MSALPFAVVCVLVLPWAADAQVRGQTTPPRRPPQDELRFREMDRNSDGVITRDEWRGSERSFCVHDWNSDGVLSGDEVRIGRWQDRNWENEDYAPELSDAYRDWTPRGFRNLDHNRDGRITRDEWHYDLETFRRVDRLR